MAASPDPGELRARVRALLRRGHSAYRGGQLVYGPLALDPRAHRVRLNGVPVDLSATEYRLLRCLMLNADAVVSRDQLNQEVWGGALDASSNTPDVYISYLRRHLAGSDGALIQTVRGLGYSLSLPRRSTAGAQAPRTPRVRATPS
jgi:two-component system OmpR family response regulator